MLLRRSERAFGGGGTCVRKRSSRKRRATSGPVALVGATSVVWAERDSAAAAVCPPPRQRLSIAVVVARQYEPVCARPPEGLVRAETTWEHRDAGHRPTAAALGGHRKTGRREDGGSDDDDLAAAGDWNGEVVETLLPQVRETSVRDLRFVLFYLSGGARAVGEWSPTPQRLKKKKIEKKRATVGSSLE